MKHHRQRRAHLKPVAHSFRRSALVAMIEERYDLTPDGMLAVQGFRCT
jgi:hypothetical protein